MAVSWSLAGFLSCHASVPRAVSSSSAPRLSFIFGLVIATHSASSCSGGDGPRGGVGRGGGGGGAGGGRGGGGGGVWGGGGGRALLPLVSTGSFGADVGADGIAGRAPFAPYDQPRHPATESAYCLRASAPALPAGGNVIEMPSLSKPACALVMSIWVEKIADDVHSRKVRRNRRVAEIGAKAIGAARV